MEPYEKIYVSKAFLDSDHGQIACEDCHGGNPQDPDWQTAHHNLVQEPAFPNPSRARGECHPDISATAPESLHYTIAPIGQAIARRMGVPTRRFRPPWPAPARNTAASAMPAAASATSADPTT